MNLRKGKNTELVVLWLLVVLMMSSWWRFFFFFAGILCVSVYSPVVVVQSAKCSVCLYAIVQIKRHKSKLVECHLFSVWLFFFFFLKNQMTLDESEIPTHCRVLATDSRSLQNHKHLRGIAPFRQNFLEARMHASNLLTGARECFPAARVAIWWQAVGGSEDESCQWRPLKRTTHTLQWLPRHDGWLSQGVTGAALVGGLSLSMPLCPPLLLSVFLSVS